MRLFRRPEPAPAPRVQTVALLVVSRPDGWRVASGHLAHGTPSWSADCADADLERVLAEGLAQAFAAAAGPHVDPERWFAGDLSAPATQHAVEDAALRGTRFFTVALGRRGCAAVRYLLNWPLAAGRAAEPLSPGHPDNGTAAYFEQYTGWGPVDLAAGAYAEPLQPVAAWLRAERGGDPRVAAFYTQSAADPAMPALPVLPEFAKTTVTGLLNDSDAPADRSGPRRLGLPDPGLTGRWRMLLHWDPLQDGPDRDAVAGHLGIVVTDDARIHWLYWPSGGGPQALAYRGASSWTMTQRQTAVRMMRDLVAAGAIPDGWGREAVG